MLFEYDQQRRISIHALREEGDICHSGCPPDGSYFYPRPPRGGRLIFCQCGTLGAIISIHALREEGDDGPYTRGSDAYISIHALREEGDRTIPVFSPGV